jgi:hypothetical protein
MEEVIKYVWNKSYNFYKYKSFADKNWIPKKYNYLNTKISCGYDKILIKLIKTWKDYINVPLSYFHTQLNSKETSYNGLNIWTLNLYLSAEKFTSIENL